PGRPRTGGTTQVFIGLGRRAGVRPQDLVGAITGETRISGRDIGSIEIADRFSLVEVPQAVADEIISGLRGTTIKGRKATVRRDRDGDGSGERRDRGYERRDRR
ncbi:DbpA RNA binding domain-containing protein, partial [Micromonospora chalcea]